VVHTASELEWLRGREYLRENRHELGVSAADGYPSAARVAGTPLLAAPGWIPARPVPLGDISISLSDEAFLPRHSADALARAVPENADGARYASYSDAMRALDAPAIFENRPLYRLTGADVAGYRPRLEFGCGRYFEALDVGTAAAHEYAAARLTPAAPDGAKGLREAIGDPCDLAARPAMMAVATLTIRLDRGPGPGTSATFPLHWRDPAKVGHAGGMYQVIPAGIFQPSGEAPWNWPNDFDLWRCMLREYAEELLGADEDHDSERVPIDYAAWPFAARMTRLRAAGRIQAWCLGLGVDPLTFATDLLTVAVFDAAAYDELFGDLVRSNAEGTVIASWPFEEQAVTELVRDHPVQAAGAALLSLALRHRDVLLLAGDAGLERDAGHAAALSCTVPRACRPATGARSSAQNSISSSALSSSGRTPGRSRRPEASDHMRTRIRASCSSAGSRAAESPFGAILSAIRAVLRVTGADARNPPAGFLEARSRRELGLCRGLPPGVLERIYSM
jgi:hypothetical protein